MPYIIMKSTRYVENPNSSHAYAGKTCGLAGVVEGKIYDCEEEAQKDADLLTDWNPVGFMVVHVKSDEE